MKIIDTLQERFAGRIEVWEKNARRIYLTVKKDDAKEVNWFIFNDLGGRFSTATGVDNPTAVEILYHFCLDQHNVILTVRVRLEKPILEIASLAERLPAAEWVEREIHEMFGVTFTGHPQMETLLLPEDWPAGVYPLRKNSFDSEKENEER